MRTRQKRQGIGWNWFLRNLLRRKGWKEGSYIGGLRKGRLGKELGFLGPFGWGGLGTSLGEKGRFGKAPFKFFYYIQEGVPPLYLTHYFWRKGLSQKEGGLNPFLCRGFLTRLGLGNWFKAPNFAREVLEELAKEGPD